MNTNPHETNSDDAGPAPASRRARDEARAERARTKLTNHRREVEAVVRRQKPIFLVVVEWPVDPDMDDQRSAKVPRSMEGRAWLGTGAHWTRGIPWKRGFHMYGAVSGLAEDAVRMAAPTVECLERLGSTHHRYSRTRDLPLIDDSQGWCAWAHAIADRVSPDRMFAEDAFGRETELNAPRASDGVEFAVFEDVALSSLQAIDSILVEMETTAPPDPCPVESPSLPVPKLEEWRAWALCGEMGKTQKEAAAIMGRETSGHWYQSKVCRSLARVARYLKAGGSMPEDVHRRLSAGSRIKVMDPHLLDKGSPTRSTQRPRGSDA